VKPSNISGGSPISHASAASRLLEIVIDSSARHVLRRVGRRAAYRVATSERVEALAGCTGFTRHLAFRHARRYVAGLNEDAALAVVRSLRAEGLDASVDLFGEDVDDPLIADALVDRYLALAARLAAYPGSYLSLDCSHLGLEADAGACAARIEAIARGLPPGMRLQLGAEQAARADAIQQIARQHVAAGLPVMQTVQANLRRSPLDVEALAAAGVPIRLVKGAYVEDAAIALRWGAETDAAYVALGRRLAELVADHSLATHDQAILEQLLPAHKDIPGPTVECLLGVRPEDARRLAADGRHVRIYVPYGERWFRYAARRAAESIGV
jgi:proline dehydrogenase